MSAKTTQPAAAATAADDKSKATPPAAAAAPAPVPGALGKAIGSRLRGGTSTPAAEPSAEEKDKAEKAKAAEAEAAAEKKKKDEAAAAAAAAAAPKPGTESQPELEWTGGAEGVDEPVPHACGINARELRSRGERTLGLVR